MNGSGAGGAGELDERLARLGPLAEPVRRALYLYVAAQPHEVSRDEAAAATGTQRSLVAFHLDKLVEAGLLEVTYRRLSGRTGPGAGRPAKLYRRADQEHAVALPPRDYELAAELLATAVEEGSGPPAAAVADVADRYGREVGAEVRGQLGRRASRERQMSALAEALERRGYEPYRDGGVLRLRNCPFHALADRHRDVVCGMNRALLGAVVEGAGATGLEARPERRPGECCVAIGPPAGSRAPTRAAGARPADHEEEEGR